MSLCTCAFLQVLAKIGERLGDVQVQVPPPGAAAAAAGARPPAADVPEIDNLIDAAKYGDLEAVEDFIAIGKVCNMLLNCSVCWLVARMRLAPPRAFPG